MATNTNKKDAVECVRKQIDDYRARLKEILSKTDEELEPVMVDGETSKGYYVQTMINPKIPARIMLDYDYPIFAVLGDDAPDAMWNEMALELGLETVTSVDL